MVANSNVPIHSRLWCVYEAGKPGSRRDVWPGESIESTMWFSNVFEWRTYVSG